MNIQAIDWLHAGPPMAAGFLASLVEAVEAMTLVLAAGSVRGWRSALLGAAAGVLLLVTVVAIFGKTIGLVPIELLQVRRGWQHVGRAWNSLAAQGDAALGRRHRVAR